MVPAFPPTILEKDLKARLEQGKAVTLTIHAAPNHEFYVQHGHGKSSATLTTTTGRIRMFKDLTRLVRWAEDLGISRLVMDISLPLPSR